MSTTGARSTRSIVFRHLGVVAVAAGLVALIAEAAGAAFAPPAPPAQDSVALIARGDYLANKVAMCVQCHSGRDGNGDLIESQKFRGGPMPVRSPYANREWAVQAPALAGLPGFTDAQVIALLTEGQTSGRPAPRAPMPPFRLSRADAEAVVAYLRTR